MDFIYKKNENKNLFIYLILIVSSFLYLFNLTTTVVAETAEKASESIRSRAMFDPNLWLNVTFPTKVAYKSDDTTKHNTFVSKKYEIKNNSEKPVRVELKDFRVDPTSNGTDVEAIKKLHKLLAIKTGRVSKSLIVEGALERGLSGTELMVLDSDATQGTNSLPKVGTFEFTGNTSDTFDSSKMKSLSSELELNFVPLNEDGTTTFYRVEMVDKKAEMVAGTNFVFTGKVLQSVNGKDDPTPVQTPLTWSVTGATGSTTIHATKGDLTIDPAATNSQLIVTAKAHSVTGTPSTDFTVNVQAAPVPTYHIEMDHNNPITIESGTTAKFKAKVKSTLSGNVTDASNQNLVWSVSGQTSAITTIDSAGQLRAGADETSSKLKVTAKSVPYNVEGKSDVTLAKVTYRVEMVDKKAEMNAGSTFTFTAKIIKSVDGKDDPTPVQTPLTWSVTGATGTTAINVTTGHLSIDSAASDSTVRVTAKANGITGTPSVDFTVKVSKTVVIDNRDGTVDFANEKWSIIKDMGNGNKLIAMQKKIGDSRFTDSSQYFSSSFAASDGYLTSIVRGIVDGWYRKNIAGTDFETAVLPVTLSNPILGNKKTTRFGEWRSYQIGESIPGFLATNQPDAFPTKIDGIDGKKQAFLMSGSDVSNGQGQYGDLTPEALRHRDNLTANGVNTSWLRSPGIRYNQGTYIYSGIDNLYSGEVGIWRSVVPSLVVHIP